MQRFAFSFTDLTASIDGMISVRICPSNGVGEGIVSQIVGDISFQSGFSPFVEAFEQCNGEGVVQFIETCLVVDRVVGKVIKRVRIISVGNVMGGIEPLVVVELERVDETRDGYIFRFVPERVFCSFLLNSHETVSLLCIADGDTLALCAYGIFRLVACDDCVLRTSFYGLLVVILVLVE